MKVTQPQPKFFPLRFFLIILSFFFSALALANTPIDTLRIRSILLKNIPPVTLIAQDDTYTVTTSSEKQYVGSVFDNDRWGTTTPTDETVQLFAVSGTTDSNGDKVLRIATKGRILIPAHTPVGSYKLLYQICEQKLRKYCQTATVTVFVLPKTVSPTTQTPTTTTGTTQTNTTVTPTTQTNTTVTPTTQTNTTVTPTTLIAQDDTYTVRTSSEKQYVGSVFDNDRWGTTTPTDETVRLFAVSGTTDSNGDKVLRTATKGRILIPAHTPVGTYELLYQICEQKLRKHCQTATVTVIVLPKTVSPTTQTNTTTTSTTQTNTTQTPTTSTPTIQTPTTVTPTPLIAQDDTYTITTSSEKQYVGSIFDNDRWGTTTPTDETVRLFAVSGTTDNKGDLVLRTASKGRILVPAHTTVGTYQLLYRICDRKNRKHCQTATVTVIVLPKTVSPTTQTPTTTTSTTQTNTTQTPTTSTPTTLIAQDDTYTVTTSSERQYVGSVFDNDRWGTTTPTDETVWLFAVSGTTDSNGDKVLRTATKGRILVPAHTPVGTYKLLYQICEQKLRKHCQTATVTVIVLPKIVSPTTQTPTTTTSTTQTPTTVTPTAQTNTTVTPTTLIPQDDTYTITTSSEKQYVGSVFDNDRWGTTTPTYETVGLFAVSGTTDSKGGLVLRTASKGRILVPAHTPVGTYELLYQICEQKLYKHCQTATVTVIVLPKVVSPTTQTPTTTTGTTQTTTTVTPTTLIAQDDTYTVTTSSEKQYVGSVFDNDRWGTTTPTDETVGLFAVSGTTDNKGDLVLRTASKGRILVPADTPVGTYELLYRICDRKIHKHCQTATVTVIVLPKTVSPTTKTPTTTTGTTQTPTTATPTTQTNTTVTPTTLIAQDDTYTVTTSSERQYVGSVFNNDRWGTTTPTDETVGLFAVSGTTDSNRDLVLRIASKGRVLVPAHTPVGSYQLLYRICDRKIHKHCQTATVTVIVLPKVVSPTTQTPTTTTSTTQTNTTQTPTTSTPTTQTPTTVTSTTLIAQDDTYTITTSSEKQYVGSVFDNDRWGTTTPTDETVGLFTVSGTTDSKGDLVLKTASKGRILVPAHTPVGTYQLLYRICDRKDHTLCQTATVTVIVLPKTVSPTTQTNTTTTSTTQTNTTVTPTTLIAQDDTYTVTTSSEKQYVGSVFDNDRWSTTTPTDETVRLFAVSGTTDSNGDLVLRTATKGRVLVPAHTPVGTYKLLYQICEQKLRKHCQTASVTVIVLPKVVSPTTQTPTTTTGTTQTPTTVTPTAQTNTTVTPTTLIAQDDTYTVTTSSEKQYVGSVFDNDRWGTTTPTDETVRLFAVSGTTDNKGDLVLRTASKGRILVPAHTPAGTYELLYRICDREIHKHCQTATVTVIVLPKTVSPTTQTPTTTTSTTQTNTTQTPTTSTPTTLIAQDDTYTVTTSSEKQYVGSVFDNDRWGTTTPTDETVGLFAVSGTTDSKGDLVLRTASKGRMLVPAHTPAGTYELLYRICDRKIHKHCQTATVTVIVLPKVVSPTTQTPTTTTSTTQTATTVTPTTQTNTTVTPTTLIAQDDTYTVTTSPEKQYIGSVFDNDRWGTITPTDETVGLFAVSGTTDSKGGLVLRTASEGRILVPAHTPVGTYKLLYRICDRKIRKHCQTATVTVIILPKTVSPTTQTNTTITSTTQTATTVTPTAQTNTTQTETSQEPIAVPDNVSTTMNIPIRISILNNDTPYNAIPIIISIPLKGTAILNEDNTISYQPNSNFIGIDSFVYKLCGLSPKQCSCATVTIKVTHKIEIYNGISANNDSKNDYLHILGIENYPNNKVVIFSKDAEKVFECTHYDNVTNVFRGNYKESTKTLPSNTYFYFIEYEDEELQTKKLKGWLYLKH